MTHELKILRQYYNDSLKGKMFEIRKNDRNYHVGDKLILKEFDNGEYTGRSIERWIVYIHHGTGEFGLEKGYCVLGLTDKPNEEDNRESQSETVGSFLAILTTRILLAAVLAVIAFIAVVILGAI